MPEFDRTGEQNTLMGLEAILAFYIISLYFSVSPYTLSDLEPWCFISQTLASQELL